MPNALLSIHEVQCKSVSVFVLIYTFECMYNYVLPINSARLRSTPSMIQGVLWYVIHLHELYAEKFLFDASYRAK